jgi:hypothetical protein
MQEHLPYRGVRRFPDDIGLGGEAFPVFIHSLGIIVEWSIPMMLMVILFMKMLMVAASVLE